MFGSGFLAMSGVVLFLMNFGLKYHDNYEYFGALWHDGYPAIFMMWIAGTVGFALPGLVFWRLRGRDDQRQTDSVFVV
jgi:hypothetical protein